MALSGDMRAKDCIFTPPLPRDVASSLRCARQNLSRPWFLPLDHPMARLVIWPVEPLVSAPSKFVATGENVEGMGKAAIDFNAVAESGKLDVHLRFRMWD